MKQLANQSLSFLSAYHAVVIERMGGGDPRDPNEVATQITGLLEQHWRFDPPQQPLLIVTQGDPPESSGISAITLQTARQLRVDRGVACLDEEIADDHEHEVYPFSVTSFYTVGLELGLVDKSAMVEWP